MAVKPPVTLCNAPNVTDANKLQCTIYFIYVYFCTHHKNSHQTNSSSCGCAALDLVLCDGQPHRCRVLNVTSTNVCASTPTLIEP